MTISREKRDHHRMSLRMMREDVPYRLEPAEMAALLDALDNAEQRAELWKKTARRMNETHPLPMPEPEEPAFEPCYFVPTDRLAELYDAEQRLQAVRDAWNIPGPVPSYHRRAQDRLRRDWPTLARALDGDA